MIGALGTTPIKLRNWSKETGIETQITELQKTVLHCLNPQKSSRGLSELVVTGPQEHKSTVKTVCHIISNFFHMALKYLSWLPAANSHV